MCGGGGWGVGAGVWGGGGGGGVVTSFAPKAKVFNNLYVSTMFKNIIIQQRVSRSQRKIFKHLLSTND